MSISKELPLDFWAGRSSEEGCSPENVLADIIHETYQPIQEIKGWSRALLTVDLSEEQQLHALKSILAGATYLESIIKAAMEYTNKLHE